METYKPAADGFLKANALAVGGQSLTAAATAMSSPGRKARQGSTQLQELNSAPCFVQKLLTESNLLVPMLMGLCEAPGGANS